MGGGAHIASEASPGERAGCRRTGIPLSFLAGAAAAAAAADAPGASTEGVGSCLGWEGENDI